MRVIGIAKGLLGDFHQLRLWPLCVKSELPGILRKCGVNSAVIATKSGQDALRSTYISAQLVQGRVNRASSSTLTSGEELTRVLDQFGNSFTDFHFVGSLESFLIELGVLSAC
jgi:hypothetical protein